jgi:hypothetical protein
MFAPIYTIFSMYFDWLTALLCAKFSTCSPLCTTGSARLMSSSHILHVLHLTDILPWCHLFSWVPAERHFVLLRNNGPFDRKLGDRRTALLLSAVLRTVWAVALLCSARDTPLHICSLVNALSISFVWPVICAVLTRGVLDQLLMK